MKIGIIGAGMIGGTLARRLTELGHEVKVANSRGPGTLAEIAAETGATPATVRDAVRGAEMVVVAIHQGRVRELPADLFVGASPDPVVVDTGNYYPRERDGRIEEIEAGLPESRWVERQLGHPVIKAFNTIWFRSLGERGQPPGTPGRIALPVAGDDRAAKDRVMALIDELGFDAVDAGGIDESWRQQAGTPVYTADEDRDGIRRGLAAASPERPEKFIATDRSPGTFETPA